MTTVLIDGYALGDGSRRRGIGTFLNRLITGLADDPQLPVSVLATPGTRLPIGVQTVEIRRLAPARLEQLEHDFWLPRDIRRAAPGVFYSPAQQPPRRSAVPWVQTLHDLIPITRPHPLLDRDRRRWLRIGPRLRRAAAIVAVSRFSADEGIRHLDLDPRRVHVVPAGVDTDVFRPGEAPAVDAPYVLHVAAWGPHKGFEEALKVVAGLAARGLPHRLVFAGPQDDWMMSQIQRAVAASPRPDRVDVVGYVDDLPALYRGATALLMTSRCEGFGLPALEAMACGTATVAFANSSLIEVVGDGGLLISDGDVEAMVAAVERIARDEHVRAELGESGIARASRFRWDDAVAAYAQLFDAVSH